MDEEDEYGLRQYGHSKDHRPDLPQVVIGLAVTKEGIPVKCWTMPGNTSDMKTVETVKNDFLGWKLGRCIWVMDRGMSSEENRLILQKAGGHYIIGEKLRDNQEVHKEVLAKRGRFTAIRENLEIKEVIVGDGERRRRFILVHNPEEAKKDKTTVKSLTIDVSPVTNSPVLFPLSLISTSCLANERMTNMPLEDSDVVEGSAHSIIFNSGFLIIKYNDRLSFGAYTCFASLWSLINSFECFFK